MVNELAIPSISIPLSISRNKHWLGVKTVFKIVNKSVGYPIIILKSELIYNKNISNIFAGVGVLIYTLSITKWMLIRGT